MPANKNLIEREEMKDSRIFHPSRILSTESLSSGYNTDHFRPVSTDTIDKQDYELWERKSAVAVAGTVPLQNSPM